MDLSYEELVAKYGEDNAAFLAETLGGSGSHYERIAWIEMGVEPDGRFERHAREEAAQRGWTFDHQRGDLTLLRRLLDGPWDEDFLVLQPGQRAVATHDDGLLRAEPAE